MRIFICLVLVVLGLASPALAESWRVVSVSGDAVSIAPYTEPEPIDAGNIVHDGAALVSGPLTLVKLKRGGDRIDVKSDTIVELRHSDTMRAVIEMQTGHLEIVGAAGSDGPLRVGARYFQVEAQDGSFSVDVHKDYATVDVLTGEVTVIDLIHPGVVKTLRAGSEFRGSADAKGSGAPDDEEAKEFAAAEAALKDLDKLAEQQKRVNKEERKKRNAVLKKLAEKGLTATKEGLQQLGEDYENDGEVEIPKTGILQFLFGENSPGVGYVLAGTVVMFLLFGRLAANALGEVAFGMVGNALILLVGALIGAAVHDFLFTPDLFWSYEPTPGIVTPTVFAAVMLVASCFLRRFVEDRLAEAADRPSQPDLRAPRRKFG